MATAYEVPTLDQLLDSILDRLPVEAVIALAEAPPADPAPPATLADELVRKLRDKAKVWLEAKSGPLPDEPDFNEETRRVLEDVREGKGLIRYDSLDALFKDMGV